MLKKAVLHEEPSPDETELFDLTKPIAGERKIVEGAHQTTAPFTNASSAHVRGDAVEARALIVSREKAPGGAAGAGAAPAKRHVSPTASLRRQGSGEKVVSSNAAAHLGVREGSGEVAGSAAGGRNPGAAAKQAALVPDSLFKEFNALRQREKDETGKELPPLDTVGMGTVARDREMSVKMRNLEAALRDDQDGKTYEAYMRGKPLVLNKQQKQTLYTLEEEDVG